MLCALRHDLEVTPLAESMPTMFSTDEGYIDEEMLSPVASSSGEPRQMSVREREGMWPNISPSDVLSISPRRTPPDRNRIQNPRVVAEVKSRCAAEQDRAAPQARHCRGACVSNLGPRVSARCVDTHTHDRAPQLLPTEVALHVFSYLPHQSLLTCALVSKRWRALADDQSLWKSLCLERKWEWRAPPDAFQLEFANCHGQHPADGALGSDDEGMGDEEDDDDSMQVDDSGFASMDVDEDDSMHPPLPSPSATATAMRLSIPTHILTPAIQSQSPPSSSSTHRPMRSPRTRHSAPSILQLPAAARHPYLKPNYKLLHQTHVRLRNRFSAGSYTLSNLQTRGAPNSHSNTIYCLQLYTYPETGTQVLFTGSKDRTIREWDLSTGSAIRVLEGVHESSVLSICVHGGLLASASSDRRVVVWDLAKDQPIKIIREHEDSVLCVRFDDKRLVSCSKGEQTISSSFTRVDVELTSLQTERSGRTFSQI